MIVVTGSFTSDGARRTIPCVDGLGRSFIPALYFTRASTADYFAFYSRDLWCGRSNAFQADSFNNGVRFAPVAGSDTEWVIHIGTDSKVNGVAGTINYYTIIGESTDNDLELTSYQGNNTTGREMALINAAKTQLFNLIKRDSTLPAISRAVGTNASIASGGAPADTSCLVINTPAGEYTISDFANVNEYDGLTKGEGINTITVFNDSPNVELLTWTGNGVAGRVIPSSFPLKAVLVFSTTGSVSGRYITDAMTPEQGANFQNTAMSSLTNVGHVASDGLHLTNGAPNSNTVVYFALAFGSSDALTPKPAIEFDYAGRKAIYLAGGTSKIECGTSNTLQFNGAMSLEWMGRVSCNSFADGGHCPLIIRGLNNVATAGNASWGIVGAQIQSGVAYWPGHQFAPVVKDLADYSTPIPDMSWRTGIIMPYGTFFHVSITHDGVGGWRMMLTTPYGRWLSKQRAISVSPNIAGGTGHRTIIGGQPTTAAGTINSQRMLFMFAQIFTRQWTIEEQLVRSRIMFEGSGEPDISQTDYLESWSAEDATGTSLPAGNAAANDGTITFGIGGSIITL